MDQITRPSVQRLLALDFFAGMGRFQDSMFLISLAVAAGESGFDSGQAGVAVGGYLSLSAVTAGPKGRLLDRRGTQRPAQFLLMGVAVSFFGILFGLREASFPLLLASCLALGALRLNSGMMMQALWSTLSEDPLQFAQASARETLITAVSQTIGPLLAAVLVAFGGGTLALASCGVLVTGSMLIWLSLAPDVDTPPSAAGSQTSERSTRIPQRVLGPLLVGSLLALPLAALQLALAASESGASAALLVATFTFGSALAMTVLSATRRFRPLGGAGLIPIAPIILSISFLIMALGNPSQGVLAAALMVSGGSFSLASVSNRVSIHSHTRGQSSNQAFGILVTGAAAASGAGAILFGQIYEQLGFSGASLTFSILLLVSALMIFLLGRSNRLGTRGK